MKIGHAVTCMPPRDRRWYRRNWRVWVEGSDPAHGLASYTGGAIWAWTERGAHYKGSRAALKYIEKLERERSLATTTRVRPWEES